MNTVYLFILCVLIQSMFVCVFMLYRNNCVYNIQKELGYIASLKAQKSIDNGDYNWMRYYNAIEAISYDDMLNKHLTKWKLEDFYVISDNEISLKHQAKDRCND